MGGVSLIHIAIRNVHSNVAVVTGNTVDDVVCTDTDGNSVTIDKTAVTTENNKLQAEYDAQEYARNREVEYPSIQECVHAMLDNDNNELDALQAKRTEIKLKYPKGG